LISVYKIALNQVSEYSDVYCSKHFPERFKKSKQFVFKEDRLRCIGAGILLYEVLKLEDKDVKKGEFGYPYSDSIREYFNISHSGDYVVLAVSDNKVGIDIEQNTGIKDDEILPVGRTVYTENELKWIFEGIDKRKRFFMLWTLKESISKAFGMGLTIDVQSFDVTPIINDNTIEINGRTIYGKVFSDSEKCLSVCSIDKPCIIDKMPFDMTFEN